MNQSSANGRAKTAATAHGTASAQTTPNRTSRTQHVYAAIRDDIVRTRIAPGAVILETELAERFGVSKTPVREALQILAVEDLVTIIPRRGYVVRELGINDVREVLDLRSYIEPPLTASAARRATPELLNDLQRIYETQLKSTGVGQLTAAARMFHERIHLAAHNRRVQSILSGLFDETTRSHHLLPAIGEHIESEIEQRGHERILEAISQRDPEAAEQAMRDHLAELRQTMIEAFLDQ